MIDRFDEEIKNWRIPPWEVPSLWNYEKFLRRSKTAFTRFARSSSDSLLLDPRDDPSWYPSLDDLRNDPFRVLT